MRSLSSYLEGQWVTGEGDATLLHDASTTEAIASVCSTGLDRGAALRYARQTGGPALRAMSFAQRGAMLEQLAGIIHAHRDELLLLSTANGGTTRGDGKFNVDGAAATLGWYAYLGKKLGNASVLLDGEPERVLRSKRFVGQHIWSSRRGAAIHINAFNFPAWGLAEKAAVAWLAGLPVVTKPGTATAWLTHRIVELWVASGALPAGAVSLLVGSAGDLLDHVEAQDCVAFTGGSETAAKIRGHRAVVAHNVRLNIEADSLNASVLGPDVELDIDTWQMFVNQVVKDLTQKCGQKCTAVRRLMIPSDRIDDVVEALTDRLDGALVGLPTEKGVDIGPAASAAQQASVQGGIAQLAASCERVWQGPTREDGYFVTPSLFRSDAGLNTPFVHEHEVFGPVATLLTYDGSAAAAVELVAAGGGGLVASVYSNDPVWAGQAVLGMAPYSGRVHWGSEKVADQSPGPGTVLPNLVHGGPGKAGGGEELGGVRGLHFYMQRSAIQADKGLLDRAFKAAGVLDLDEG